MKYEYFRGCFDLTKFNVLDMKSVEWRGVITEVKHGKWQSEKGHVFDTQEEAANHNNPGSPPFPWA